MTKKLAVFDLDGTLSRTELFSVPAAQEMERLLGYPVQEASHIIASFGTNYKDTMDAIFPGWDQKAYDFYFTHGGEIQAKYLDRAMPYDGIPEAMDRLHAIGYETAVCSNSNIRYIKMCVSAIGLKDKNGLSSGTGGWNGSQGPKPGQAFKRGFSGKSCYGR